MKILVIDDDVFFTKIISRHVKQAGYEVLVAYDGEEAFNLIQNERPDLVLLDLMLPKMAGFAILEKMKAGVSNGSADLSKIPVIIVSNLAQDSDVAKGMELGAKEYLVKSEFSLEELPLKIKKYLK